MVNKVSARRIRDDLFEAFTQVEDRIVRYYNPESDTVIRLPRGRHSAMNRYIEIPPPTLASELQTRRDYANTVQDEATREALLLSLESRRVFHEFSEIVRSSHRQGSWHRFRTERIIGRMRTWAAAAGIEFRTTWVTLAERDKRDQSRNGSQGNEPEQLPAPSEVVDQLLVQAAELIRSRGDEEYLAELGDALLRFVGVEEPVDGPPIQRLFDQAQSRDHQRLFAAALVRLLGTSPELFERNLQLKLGALKLSTTLPEVYRQLGIGPEQQTYLTVQALRSAMDRAMAPVVEVLASLGDLVGFGDYRQRLKRALSGSLVQALIAPFLPGELGSTRLDEGLRAAQEYLDAPPANKLQSYQQAIRVLEEYRAALQQSSVSLVKVILLPIPERLLVALHQDYTESPLSKPASLEVYAPEKKYPFCVKDAVLELGFIVENIGIGYAQDVAVTVEAEDYLRINEQTRVLGEVGPGVRFGGIEYTGQVLVPSTRPLLVQVRVSWTNFDGTQATKEEVFELESQSGEIRWHELALLDPYSLEPVSEVDELVGRTELLNTLEGRIRSTRVGSFWVYGQKRVGKTSLVKTLHSRIASHDPKFIVVYLEVGDYVDPDPRVTIERLGTKICEGVRRAAPKFNSLPIPKFSSALSPLDDFLRSVLDVDAEARVLIVLDEFDELPIDLYRRGGIGDAFFLTIRSISGKPQFGFVLVGGEKMEFVLSVQGDTLNKFRPIRVDYFDRQSHWADFEELVRKPVSPWATISDGAVANIYNLSAGNPFFAKLICGTLFADMVARRDAFVTERETHQAIYKTVAEAGSNQFQHFWEDGIFEISGDRIEEKSMRRRRVLIVLAEILRSRSAATVEAIFQRAREYNLTAAEVRQELADFERRTVLAQSHGRFECTVGMFGQWLIERGVREIVTSFTDLDAILERTRRDEEMRVSAAELGHLVRHWGVYKGREVGHESVRAWLDQFKDASEQRLMFQLLQGVRFYSSSAVRAKLREAHGIVVRELARRGIARREEQNARKRTDNMLLSYAGGAGKSGPFYTRLYADENSIYADRVIGPDGLADAISKSTDVHALVLVDDFLGTGRQAEGELAQFITRYGDLIREKELLVFFICVAGFVSAADRLIRKFRTSPFIRIHVCDPLAETDRCFNDESAIFPDPSSRVRAEEIARGQGALLEPKQPMGYGDCQASVVFEFNCPNNTLPILWKRGKTWEPLFPRH
jgi:hypothetical protein